MMELRRRVPLNAWALTRRCKTVATESRWKGVDWEEQAEAAKDDESLALLKDSGMIH